MYFIACQILCLVERGFSAIALRLFKQVNRLKITERRDPWLPLSEFQPDVDSYCHHPRFFCKGAWGPFVNFYSSLREVNSISRINDN